MKNGDIFIEAVESGELSYKAAMNKLDLTFFSALSPFLSGKLSES